MGNLDFLRTRLYGAAMGKGKDTLTPIGDILGDLLAGDHLPFHPEDARVWKVWEDAVGSAIAQHARPLWIKGGRLRVAVSDPIWLQELTFAEQQIRQALNERLGREAVKKVEFRMGPG
jgi:predicted nucleic acid-binding Zn ribbon protein